MKNHIELAKKIYLYKKNKSIYKKKINFGFKILNRFDFNDNCKKYLNEVLKIL